MQTNPAGFCDGIRSIDELVVGIVGSELKIKPKRKGRSLSRTSGRHATGAMPG
jgi:hypothetical protein